MLQLHERSDGRWVHAMEPVRVRPRQLVRLLTLGVWLGDGQAVVAAPAAARGVYSAPVLVMGPDGCPGHLRLVQNEKKKKKKKKKKEEKEE